MFRRNATDIFLIIEEYTCHLYGYKKEADIHDVIKTHFKKKTKPKLSKKPLECIKSIEPQTFPECRDVLIQQIKRSWFIAKLCTSASLPHPTEDLAPINFGWILDGQFLAIKWFEGLQVPQELQNVDYLSESDAEESNIDELDDEDALEINNDEIGIAPI